MEAPMSKHQIANNIQIPISNGPNGFVLEFGHLVIGNYLEFGLPARSRFGEGRDLDIGIFPSRRDFVPATLG
jgi:hypothetical protein